VEVRRLIAEEEDPFDDLSVGDLKYLAGQLLGKPLEQLLLPAPLTLADLVVLEVPFDLSE
jgi:hypothetical protein